MSETASPYTRMIADQKTYDRLKDNVTREKARKAAAAKAAKKTFPNDTDSENEADFNGVIRASPPPKRKRKTDRPMWCPGRKIRAEDVPRGWKVTVNGKPVEAGTQRVSEVEEPSSGAEEVVVQERAQRGSRKVAEEQEQGQSRNTRSQAKEFETQVEALMQAMKDVSSESSEDEDEAPNIVYSDAKENNDEEYDSDDREWLVVDEGTECVEFRDPFSGSRHRSNMRRRRIVNYQAPESDEGSSACSPRTSLKVGFAMESNLADLADTESSDEQSDDSSSDSDSSVEVSEREAENLSSLPLPTRVAIIEAAFGPNMAEFVADASHYNDFSGMWHQLLVSHPAPTFSLQELSTHKLSPLYDPKLTMYHWCKIKFDKNMRASVYYRETTGIVPPNKEIYSHGGKVLRVRYARKNGTLTGREEDALVCDRRICPECKITTPLEQPQSLTGGLPLVHYNDTEDAVNEDPTTAEEEPLVTVYNGNPRPIVNYMPKSCDETMIRYLDGVMRLTAVCKPESCEVCQAQQKEEVDEVNEMDVAEDDAMGMDEEDRMYAAQAEALDEADEDGDGADGMEIDG